MPGVVRGSIAPAAAVTVNVGQLHLEALQRANERDLLARRVIALPQHRILRRSGPSLRGQSPGTCQAGR